jgi:mono/diheme cytochrome c family protein
MKSLLKLVVLAPLMAMTIATTTPAAADDELLGVNDIALPFDNPEALELGKQRFGEKCGGFCHGSGGKGGRGPCLICNRFKHGGRASDLVRNIGQGIVGTPMGAFGEVFTRDEILAVVAYLRLEQKKKLAAEQ